MDKIDWWLILALNMCNATFCYVMQEPDCIYLAPLRGIFLGLLATSVLQIPVAVLAIFKNAR